MGYDQEWTYVMEGSTQGRRRRLYGAMYQDGYEYNDMTTRSPIHQDGPCSSIVFAYSHDDIILNINSVGTRLAHPAS
jgi:hypothetical protein